MRRHRGLHYLYAASRNLLSRFPPNCDSIDTNCPHARSVSTSTAWEFYAAESPRLVVVYSTSESCQVAEMKKYSGWIFLLAISRQFWCTAGSPRLGRMSQSAIAHLPYTLYGGMTRSCLHPRSVVMQE